MDRYPPTEISPDDRAPVVFVVDDDPQVLQALGRLFRSVGLPVETFPSATEFLAAVSKRAGGCLVLDLQMPDMTGIELQQRMAELGIALPIVFITGHGDIRTGVRAMKEGAIDFLEKPFDDETLLAAVDSAMQRSEQERAEADEQSDLLARYERLTPREREIMAFVVSGMRNKRIAWQLGRSEKTVKVHRARVMKKMEVRSLAELVRSAEKLSIELPAKEDATG
jgi:FixJ family two-component response regulator